MTTWSTMGRAAHFAHESQVAALPCAIRRNHRRTRTSAVSRERPHQSDRTVQA